MLLRWLADWVYGLIVVKLPLVMPGGRGVMVVKWDLFDMVNINNTVKINNTMCMLHSMIARSTQLSLWMSISWYSCETLSKLQLTRSVTKRITTEWSLRCGWMTLIASDRLASSISVSGAGRFSCCAAAESHFLSFNSHHFVSTSRLLALR